MRREIRNLVVVLALIAAVGALAAVMPGGLARRAAAGLLSAGGVLDALLVASIAVLVIAQAALTYLALRLIGRAPAGAGAPGGHGNPMLDVVWTLVPVVLVIGVGAYTFLRS